jgi:hypothetical protein
MAIGPLGLEYLDPDDDPRTTASGDTPPQPSRRS